MPDEIRDIPLELLVEPRLILRLVNRESVEYLEMRDSIAKRGLWNSICVRPCPYEDGKYEVVDGMYRFTCARELRLPSLPCIIKQGMTDDDVLAAQVQANAVRPETKPVEFARQLKRILSHRPGMTKAELAIVVAKNSHWVSERLGLLNLVPSLQKAVDRGEIPVLSAYDLARVCKGNQPKYAELAKTLPHREFKPIIAAYLKAAQEAVKQGRYDALFGEFSPVAHLRSLKELLVEYEGRKMAALQLTKVGAKTPVDGWYAALQWAMHLDEASVQEQREKSIERARSHTIQREEYPDDPVA